MSSTGFTPSALGSVPKSVYTAAAHFQVTVTAASLSGLSLVEQHRRVYEALSAPLADGTIHELRIKTKGAA